MTNRPAIATMPHYPFPMRDMKRFTALLALASFPLVVGATFLHSDTVTVRGTIFDDLYAAGGSLVLDGVIEGDAVLAGGGISLQSPVTEDAMLAAGNITINAGIGDDLRAGGGTVTVNAGVGDDAIIAGGTLVMTPEMTVGGDINAAGGQVTMQAAVAGSGRIAGGQIVFGGSVAGNLQVYGDDVMIDGTVGGSAVLVGQKLVIGDNASFAGDVQYWTKDGEVDFGDSVAGTAVFNEDLAPHGGLDKREAGAALAAIVGTVLVFFFLAGVVVLAALSLLPSQIFRRGAEKIRENPWMALLAGFLFAVATPVLAVILMMTLIGIPLGIVILLLYGITMYLAWPATALVAAYYTGSRSSKNGKMTRLGAFGLAAVYLLLLCIVKLIPFIGWLVACVVTLMGLGSLVLTVVNNTASGKRKRA